MASQCRQHLAVRTEPGRLAEELKCTPLFQALGDEGLDLLLPLLRERRYGAGETLFHEGDPVHWLFFLRAGAVKAYGLGDDGREHVLNILVAGDLFPHVGFEEQETYPATAQAIHDCETVLVSRRDVQELMLRHGEFALRYSSLLAEQLRDLQSRLRDLAGRDLQGRVALALLKLVEKENCRYRDACLLGHRRIHLTHQEIAGMVGASREAVSRVLSGFRQDGCVASGPDGLVVVDRDKLLQTL